MNRFKRYAERNRHPCVDCGKRVLKASRRCHACDRVLRRKEMSEHPVRLRHGFSDRPEYYIWVSMIQRCTNPKARYYTNYGGRGITVCKRWFTFDNFIADMGPRPSGTYPSGRTIYTIERTDNDGNYTPKNCVWATYKQQARNRTSARMITHAGETLQLSVWVEKLGLKYGVVHCRLARGWSVDRAFGIIR